jgi:drug/metabolite transporter (DMT)-like permease
MFFGSLFMLAFLVATGKASLIVSMNSQQYLWIFLTAGLLLLYVFSYYNGLKHIPVSQAACILTLGLPITVLLDAVFRGLPLSLPSAMGIVLVFAGVGLAAFLKVPAVAVRQHGRA